MTLSIIRKAGGSNLSAGLLRKVKPRQVLCHVLLLAAVHTADAQQVAPLVGGVSTLAGPGIANLVAADMIVSDSMVLPLLALNDGVEPRRLALVKAKLKISAAQLPRWSAYATAARANAAEERALLNQVSLLNPRDEAAQNLPARFAAHEKILNVHLMMLRRMSTAFLPLYASLNSEQRRSAEAIANGPVGL